MKIFNREIFSRFQNSAKGKAKQKIKSKMMDKEKRMCQVDEEEIRYWDSDKGK